MSTAVGHLSSLLTLSAQTYEFILASNGRPIPEDPRAYRKVTQVVDGFVVQNVTGLRTRIVSRMDGKGYDVTKRKSHTIRT